MILLTLTNDFISKCVFGQEEKLGAAIERYTRWR